ncbi:Predicted lipoprotein with conserved Yx(FWY)xxD motif [Actinomadura mexicana]|uniref:Predicted lipoprotein with conserved Yx(FWY)xxD motif n=2 Tax=Actinomadura mexicana TaxID=134959 RepID=A0A238WQY8_9ACTN|nr:Predicted lipoprotein with conserved Yx(FWY)xxD motif [Actinomadura mexicana]
MRRRTARSRGRLLAAPIAALAALALAGCATATNSQNPGRMQIGSDQAPHLGQILVDRTGRTLYLFVADPPNQSTCSGACASIWPPATTRGSPSTAGAARQSEITSITRSDGPPQIVYAGHPLYYYQADTGRGDIHGQALTQFGAEWYAVSPQGQQIQSGTSTGSP